MIMIAEIIDRETGRVLYEAKVVFEDSMKHASKVMQAHSMLQAEHKLLEDTLEVKWRKPS